MDDDADDQPHDHVEKGDQEPRDGVPLDELYSSVHGAVELALALQMVALLKRLLVSQGPRTKVGVYAQLLSRHGIQRKTGANFGHAF